MCYNWVPKYDWNTNIEITKLLKQQTILISFCQNFTLKKLGVLVVIYPAGSWMSHIYFGNIFKKNNKL